MPLRRRQEHGFFNSPDAAHQWPIYNPLLFAFWPASRDAGVLAATAVSVSHADPDGFDLYRLRVPAALLRLPGNRELIVIADGAKHLRFELQGASLADGPARLHYTLSGLQDLNHYYLVLARLCGLARHGRLPNQFYPSDPVAARYVRALTAWRLQLAGASQIDIAIALFGARMITADSLDAMRKRVFRLHNLASRRIAASYRHFFAG